MTELLVRVQHHPSREALLPALRTSLLPLAVEISTHASDPPNPWLGYYQAISDLRSCSHVLVLQDDVIVCKNFAPTLEIIASKKAEIPVVLFLAHLPRRIAAQSLQSSKRGLRYHDTRFRINEFCPVVGILWPVEKAKEFVAWADANPNRLGHPAPRSDDGVLGRWCALTQQVVRFTIPSLVEHPDREKSTIGRTATWGKDRGRVALNFCQDDPLDLDWS